MVAMVSEAVTGKVKVLAAVCAPAPNVTEKVLAGFLNNRKVSLKV